jgi:hypothetical protein
VRRSSETLSCLLCFDIFVSGFERTGRRSGNAMTLQPGMFPMTISEFGSIPARFQISLR